MAERRVLLQSFKPENPSHWAAYVGLAAALGTWVVSLRMNWGYVGHWALLAFCFGAAIGVAYGFGHWRGHNSGKKRLNREWVDLKRAIEDATDLGNLFDTNYVYLTEDGKKCDEVRFILDFWTCAVLPGLRRMREDDVATVCEAASLLHLFATYAHEFARSNGHRNVSREFEELYNRRITNRIEPIASAKRFVDASGRQLWYPRGEIRIARIA